MEKDEYTWNCVTNRFRLFRKILGTLFVFDIFLKSCELYIYGNLEDLAADSSPIIRVFYLGFLYSIPEQSKLKRAFMIHCLLEFLYLHCIYLGSYILPAQKTTVGLVAAITVFNFQAMFMPNLYVCVVFAFKFMVELNWELFLDSVNSRESFATSILVIICVTCIIVNNELLKRSDERTQLYLQKSQKIQVKLSVLVQNFPAGLAVISLDWRVKIANQKILTYLNCSQEELVRVLRSLEYAPDRRFSFSDLEDEGVFCDIERSASLEHNQELDLGLIHINDFNLQFCVKKIKWGDGKALLLSINNAEKLIALEKADAQNNCKNTLLRSVSHEMRTPLYAITNIADRLFEDSSERTQENLEILMTSSRLLMCLVNDLLDYSRILNQAFGVNSEYFNIRQLLQDSMKLIEMQARTKKIRLLLRIDPLLPQMCFCDPTRIEQIIINLMSNALKFTSKGYIEVCVTFSYFCKLKVTVKDTGVGIPPEKLSRLFQLFETSNNGRFNSQGCGLGLHISNLLVELLGGSGIEVKSSVGQGSVFSFEVPCLEVTPEVEPTDEPDLVPEETETEIEVRNLVICREKTNSKILLVDDNEFNRLIIGTVLKANQKSFLEASNGQEALELVKKQSEKGEDFKVILMDCEMPVMNGWEATLEIHKLHSEGKLNLMPNIIGCSAFSDETEIKKSYDSGMHIHLVKPIKNDVLLHTLDYFLTI